jgi:hypothetical protein
MDGGTDVLEESLNDVLVDTVNLQAELITMHATKLTTDGLHTYCEMLSKFIEENCE